MDAENIDDFSNKVVNFLKTNGKFDEFRQKCATEIEHHVSVLSLHSLNCNPMMAEITTIQII